MLKAHIESPVESQTLPDGPLAGLAYKQAVRALELALTTQGQGRKVDPSPTVRPHRPAHSLAK